MNTKGISSLPMKLLAPDRKRLYPSTGQSLDYSLSSMLVSIPESLGRPSVGEKPQLSGHRGPPDSTPTVRQSAAGARDPLDTTTRTLISVWPERGGDTVAGHANPIRGGSFE